MSKQGSNMPRHHDDRGGTNSMVVGVGQHPGMSDQHA